MNPELGCGSFRTAQRSLQGDEARQLRQKDQPEGLAKGAVRAHNRVMAQLFGGTAYERCFEGQTGSVTFVQHVWTHRRCQKVMVERMNRHRCHHLFGLSCEGHQ
jgi:hypothetical protein